MSARFWMLVPVMLLGSTVAFAAWRIALVVNDPSFAEEEHAYERGLDWDSELERRAAQAALGWTVSVEAPRAGADGELLVRVIDRSGAPVAGLSGQSESFHNSFPGEVSATPLAERMPGTLVGAIAPDRPGLWQWRLELANEAGVWQGSVRAEVPR